MASSYDVGDLVRCTGTWTNSGGTATDPTAVLFQVTPPGGTVTTYTYGTDAELVKSSTGIYYVDVNANTAGDWHFRFYSTGTGQAAAESRFLVKTSGIT